MPVYTVVNASMKKAVQGKHGPMQVVALDLRDPDGKELGAEWFTKAETALPAAGATLDGTVELTDYGWKFRKANGFAGGGGGFARAPQDDHPVRRAGIVRQHSQSCALAAMELAFTLGILTPPKDTTEFFALIRKTAGWFDTDVQEAREAAK